MGNIILQTEVILSRKNHDVKGIIPIIDWKTDSDTFLLNEKKEHNRYIILIYCKEKFYSDLIY